MNGMLEEYNHTLPRIVFWLGIVQMSFISLPVHEEAKGIAGLEI